MDDQLKDMFETLEQQPVPDRLLSLIDQLDEELQARAPQSQKRRAHG